ncbi:MAG: hypothetical protein AAF478_05425 [Pseudomonadota bacterium]
MVGPVKQAMSDNLNSVASDTESTQMLRELIIRHTTIRVQIEQLLETETDLTHDAMAELDSLLESNFQEIMTMNLDSDSEKLERIQFAIAEISAICENGALAKTLTDRIYKDASSISEG